MMPQLPLSGTDLRVSAMAYGMSRFGTMVSGEQARRLYDTFRQTGGNFFDTAHCYAFWERDGLGASERALGELVRSRGDRGNVVIATKGGHHQVLPGYERPDRYLSGEVIARDVADSLQRLDIDTIDIYLLHRDDRRVSVAEIIDALNEHVQAGRLRYLGVSNWTTERIAQANAYAAATGKRGLCISQPRLSLAVPTAPATDDRATRSLEPADFDWHARTGTAVMAYSSTGCGYFATDGVAGAGTFDNPVSRRRLGNAKQLAAELGVPTTQVALAWLMHQSFPVIPILGTTDHQHLTEALGSCDVKLTNPQVQRLTQ